MHVTSILLRVFVLNRRLKECENENLSSIGKTKTYGVNVRETALHPRGKQRNLQI